MGNRGSSGSSLSRNGNSSGTSSGSSGSGNSGSGTSGSNIGSDWELADLIAEREAAVYALDHLARKVRSSGLVRERRAQCRTLPKTVVAAELVSYFCRAGIFGATATATGTSASALGATSASFSVNEVDADGSALPNASDAQSPAKLQSGEMGSASVASSPSLASSSAASTSSPVPSSHNNVNSNTQRAEAAVLGGLLLAFGFTYNVTHRGDERRRDFADSYDDFYRFVADDPNIGRSVRCQICEH